MTTATAIGLDVGGTQVRAARVGTAGEVLDWIAEPTAGPPEQVLAQIERLARGLGGPGVWAIGVGVPGRVDIRQQRMLSGGYVDLAGLALSERLAEAFGCPVFIDNDGSMALFAEHAVGAARSANTVVMFTIGTGIGGAVIAGGQIFRGRATAGQLGHIAVDGAGEQCLCGRRGCIETTSSGTALARHIADAGFRPGTTVETLLALSAGGNKAAEGVIKAWAGPMRLAIDTMVATLDPDLVLLGGGLGAAMCEALGTFPVETEWYRCPVVPAVLGDRAGVIGAGLSALTHRDETTSNR